MDGLCESVITRNIIHTQGQNAIMIEKWDYPIPDETLAAIAQQESEFNIDVTRPENPYIPFREIRTIDIKNNTLHFGNVNLVLVADSELNDVLLMKNNFIQTSYPESNPSGLTIESICLTCDNMSYPAMDIVFQYNCVYNDSASEFFIQYYDFLLGEWVYYGSHNSNFLDLGGYHFNEDTGEYNLNWESPLIDAGDPDNDGDGLYWYEGDITDQDPDVTRLDIGAKSFEITHGDVDNNGSIEILDVVIITDLILHPGTGLNSERSAADYNADGVIDVLDQVAIIACVIDNECLWIEREFASSGHGQIVVNRSENLNRGSGEDFIVSVESSEDIRGLQFEFSLSSQEELVSIQKLPVSDPLELEYSVNNNHVIVLLYPISGYSIPSGYHELLSIDTESINRGSSPSTPEIENIVLAGKYGNRISLDNSIEQPSEISLSTFPNPFNPETTIQYIILVDSHVSLKVYDISGRHMTELVNRIEQAGHKSVTWDATDYASGIYFVKLVTPNYSKTQKVMLLK